MRRPIAALAVAIVAAAALVPANPAQAVPPPPTLLCANDFSTTNLTGWSKSGGRWMVADGVYQQTRTTGNATSWYQAEFSAHSASARIKLVGPARASSFVSFNIATRGATTAYRLVLKAGSIAELQLLRNGTVTVLASQALPVAPDTWYAINMGIMSSRLHVIVDGVWIFGGTYVPVPADGHSLGGVGFSTSSAAGAFDDLSVIYYGPNATPKCPTTPA